jgi:AcrR family transcriptional regulator
MVASLADTLPWFGEPPFEPALRKRARRPAARDPAYVVRVLVSWLIGRPVTEIAKRAGCSPRLVYAVIRETIYEPDSLEGFYAWMDLGLIGAVDGPEGRYRAPSRETSRQAPSPLDLPVICLVCHRWIGGATAEGRRHDGSYVDLDHPLNPRLAVEARPSVQGHLVSHFLLGDDPIPYQRPSSFDPLVVELSRDPQRRAAAQRRLRGRQRWSQDASSAVMEVVRRHLRRGSPPLLPVSAGRPVEPEAARRWWAAMLEGPGHALAARRWGSPSG